MIVDTFYAVIDIEKRCLIPGFGSSGMGDVYHGGKIMLSVEIESIKPRIKWFSEGTKYFIIPEGCYTKYSREEYPELYL